MDPSEIRPSFSVDDLFPCFCIRLNDVMHVHHTSPFPFFFFSMTSVDAGSSHYSTSLLFHGEGEGKGDRNKHACLVSSVQGILTIIH